MTESRIKKSLLNARVNLIFYFLTLALSFFSRKMFLDTLGADFIGLTGTLQNLLSFLNLAELGIGSAIGYVLYKPLYEQNKEKINEIVSVFGYLYRKIGLIILGGGCLLACFLPFIFPDTIFDAGVIYFCYFTFLASSLFSYFINYRQTLLGADQRNYVVTAYFQTANLIKTLIQMSLAYHTGNYYLWIIIELIFNIIYSLILNWKINQVYPWLKSDIKIGKEKYAENKVIITKAKQLFIHLISGVGRTQLIPFLVYTFSSLKIAAYYGNYILIISKMNILLDNILGSTGAGVGNLIAEGNKQKIKSTYWGLTSLRFYANMTLVYCIYQLINPFISLWLGSEYILNPPIICIILINLFISLSRGTNEQFIYGYGIFQDIWAPTTSILILIATSVTAGSFLGIAGVLLGDTISGIIILFFWKPYFLYKYGFRESSGEYWYRMMKYIALFILTWLATQSITQAIIDINPFKSFMEWGLYGSIHFSLFATLSLIGTGIISKEFRTLLKRLIKINYI